VTWRIVSRITREYLKPYKASADAGLDTKISIKRIFLREERKCPARNTIYSRYSLTSVPKNSRPIIILAGLVKKYDVILHPISLLCQVQIFVPNRKHLYGTILNYQKRVGKIPWRRDQRALRRQEQSRHKGQRIRSSELSIF